MIVLPSSDYEKIRNLFAPLPYLSIDSVLAGLTPATVYVDNVIEPKTAVIWFQHKVLIAGEGNEQTIPTVKAFLSNQFQVDARAIGLDWFMLTGTGVLQEQFPNLLLELRQEPFDRLYYRLDTREQTWQTAVPENMELRRVDAQLLADTTLKNLDWVKEELVSERSSIADFLEKSFGYCIVHNQEIIAWCMSEYNCGTRCELGIATAEKWQRQGLARLTATAVINQALQQNIHDIGWSCWAGNRPSKHTAKALGFTRTYTNTVHLISLIDN